MKIISEPSGIRPAWLQYYERLTDRMAKGLPKFGSFLEVGAGTGQFTVLLAQHRPRCRIVALDRFAPPYENDRRILAAIIGKHRLKDRIQIEAGDYLDWMRQQSDAIFDSVISCDFVAEIDSKGLRKFITECYRLLKTRGVTVHAFLSTNAVNNRQKRLIEADSNPNWTNDPPLEWFSPNEALVIKNLRIAGFRKVHRGKVKSGLIFRSLGAKELLRS